MLWTSTTVLWTTMAHVMVEDCMVQVGLSVVLYIWLLLLNKSLSLQCCRAVITGKQTKWLQSIRTIVTHFWSLESWDSGSDKATLLVNSHARFYLVYSHPWLLTLQHFLVFQAYHPNICLLHYITFPPCVLYISVFSLHEWTGYIDSGDHLTVV